MNQKKAKALRRMAAGELNLRPNELLAHVVKKVRHPNGKIVEVEQLKNEPHSARGVTSALKKAYKQAAVAGKFKTPGTHAERKAAEESA